MDPATMAMMVGASSQGSNNGMSLLSGWLDRRYQKKMAEYAYEKDLEMWNRQNDYNSPVSQMERFKAAGLNPNLIYSQGNPGQATSMPKYQDIGGHFDTPPGIDGLAIIGAYQDFQMKNAQIDLVRKQAAIAGGQNDLLSYDLSLKEWQVAKEVPGYKWLNELGYKSLGESSLQAAELENKKRQQEIEKIAIDIGIAKTSKQWQELKLNTMLNSNVNIEKDTLLSRYIADIFGDLIKNYSDKFKRTVNKFNF